MTTGLDRLAVGFDGLVYRAHHPGWAYQPTSGEGAERHGGRFNRKGLTALYNLAGHHHRLDGGAPGQASRWNLVLWGWADGPPCSVSAIDDFGRLPNDATSWRQRSLTRC
jgi:RES domain-containing protein